MLTAGLTFVALGQWMLYADAELARTAVWVEIFKGAPLDLFEWMHLAVIQPWSPGYLVFLGYAHAVLALIGIPVGLWATSKPPRFGAGVPFGAMTGYMSAISIALVVTTPAEVAPLLRLPLGIALLTVLGGSAWAMTREALHPYGEGVCIIEGPSASDTRGGIHGAA